MTAKKPVLAAVIFFVAVSVGMASAPLPTPRWVGIFPLKGGIGLKWLDVQGAVVYRVERKKESDKEYKLLGEIKVSSFLDSKVEAEIYYYYRLRAVNEDGVVSAPSEERYARIFPPEKAETGEPEWVGIIVRTGAVGLKWEPGDGASPLAYNIYRKVGEDGKKVLVGSTDITSFLDDQVKTGQTYYYQIRAIGPDFSEGPPSFEQKVKYLRKDISPMLEVMEFATKPLILLRPGEVDTRSPTDVVFDYRNLIYFSDTYRDIIRVIEIGKGWVKDLGKDLLNHPLGIGVSSNGDLGVAEAYTGRVLVFDFKGELKQTIDIKKFSEIETCGLVDVAFHPFNGDLAAIDNYNGRVYIISEGGFLKTVFGEKGSSEGKFLAPGLAAYHPNGDLFIVDQIRSKILVFSEFGDFKYEFGDIGRGLGVFGRPKGIAFDEDGRCYVSDGLYNTIQIFLPTGQLIGYLAGREGNFLDVGNPTGIAIGKGPTVVVVEKLADRVEAFTFLDYQKLNRAAKDKALKEAGKIKHRLVPSAPVGQPTPTPTPAAPTLKPKPLAPIQLPPLKVP